MTNSSLQSSTIRLIFMVVVCFAVGFFALKPQWEVNVERRAALAIAQEQHDQNKKSLESVQNFLKDYDQHNTDVTTTNLALPVKDVDAGNFVSGLGDLAKASGITLSNLQINPTSTAVDQTPIANSIQTQGINFTASGSYPAFKDFILRLENHLRLVDIKRVTLKEDDSGLIEYQIELTTYYQQ